MNAGLRAVRNDRRRAAVHGLHGASSDCETVRADAARCRRATRCSDLWDTALLPIGEGRPLAKAALARALAIEPRQVEAMGALAKGQPVFCAAGADTRFVAHVVARDIDGHPVLDVASRGVDSRTRLARKIDVLERHRGIAFRECAVEVRGAAREVCLVRSRHDAHHRELSVGIDRCGVGLPAAGADELRRSRAAAPRKTQ